MNVPIRTVAIPNIDINVWTQKSDFPQGNLLRSLTQPDITRQITFKLMASKYDLIKDEITRM